MNPNILSGFFFHLGEVDKFGTLQCLGDFRTDSDGHFAAFDVLQYLAKFLLDLIANRFN